MATANENLLDQTVAHQVGLQRLSNATVRKIIALINRTEAELVEKMKRYDTDTSFTVRRLEKLLEALRNINEEAYATVRDELSAELKGLAAYEGVFQSTLLATTIPVQLDIVTPTAAQLYAAVNSRPFQGKLLKEWVADLETAAQVRLRGAIRMGFTEGETIDQMIRRVRGTKALQFKDGIMDITRRGAEALVRTAVNHTANTARNEVFNQNNNVIKGVQWVATLDGRTTVLCASRDGTIYPIDSGPRPPAHINCLPGNSLVTSSFPVTGASKRWYEGKMFVIRTSSGRELTCTPNHPVLSDRGWVAVQHLHLGDKVVCEGVINTPASAWFESDENHIPTSIEEIASSFFHNAGTTVAEIPVSSIDFHGDGADGQIAIVGSNRELRNRIDSSLFKKLLELFLVYRNKTMVLLTKLRSSVSFLFRDFAFVPNGLLSSSGQSFSSFGSSLLETTTQSITGGTKNESILFERSDQSWDRESMLASDITNGKTGPVFLDAIVDIRDFDSVGHVYNLETELGFYVAGGIITHNCRSTTVAVLKSWKEMGISLAEAPEGTRASMDGQVAASTTYDKWLRGRSVEFQEDILGVTKAKLFRQGGLTLDKFVDRNGAEYTLDELRKRESAAFAAAGL